MKVRFCACGQSMQNYIPHCLAIICYLRAPSKSAVAAAKHRRQINNHHRLTLQAKRKSHRMRQVFPRTNLYSRYTRSQNQCPSQPILKSQVDKNRGRVCPETFALDGKSNFVSTDTVVADPSRDFSSSLHLYISK